MKTPVLGDVINLSFLTVGRDDWLLKLTSVKLNENSTHAHRLRSIKESSKKGMNFFAIFL